MVGPSLPKFVLDSNCFIDASRDHGAATQFEHFCAQAAPRLYLSAVVAAELRAGAGRDRAKLERLVFAPYLRRSRVVVPSAAAWDMLGRTLAILVETEGMVLAQTRRSFVLDVLVAYSCREIGAVLVSGNRRDMERIAGVFDFRFVEPYPVLR